jgi:hypothetical protein
MRRIEKRYIRCETRRARIVANTLDFQREGFPRRRSHVIVNKPAGPARASTIVEIHAADFLYFCAQNG